MTTNKFTIQLINDDNLQKPSSTILYDFVAGINLEAHVQNIVSSLKAMGATFTDSIENYCLQNKKGRIFDNNESLTSQLAACDVNILNFTIKPRIRAKRCIETLKTEKNVKEYVFNLRQQLVDPCFVQEFIDSDGMLILFDLLNKTNGNTQSYCLIALKFTIANLNGMKVLLTADGLIKQLYKLTYSTSVSVCRQALELLFITCTFDEKGGEKINEAAMQVAQETGQVLFENLVNLVGSGELDTQINGLTLINNLLQTIRGEEARKTMMDHLENNLNLREILKRFTSIESEPFCHQLQFYENLTGQSILEHRGNQDTLRQLKEYQLQQPMFNIFRNELQRAKYTICQSLQYAEFLSPDACQEPRVVGEKRPLQALIRSKGAPLRQYADRLNEGESELSRNSLAEELDALAENEKNVLRIQELKEEIGKYKSRVIGLQDENQQLMLLVKDKSKQIVRESTMISKRELLAMKENIQFAIDQLKKDKQEFNQLKVKKKPLSSSVPAPSVPTVKVAKANHLLNPVLNQSTKLITEEIEHELSQEKNALKAEQIQYLSKISVLDGKMESIKNTIEILEKDLGSLKEVTLVQSIELDEAKLNKDISTSNVQQLVNVVKILKLKHEKLKAELNANAPAIPASPSLYEAMNEI